jgi:DNA repair exonuclease SbcCD nuclease subunit
MSKIIILGDTHLGARNGSNKFSTHFNKFFTELLYPYTIKHGIKEIYQLGDLFDNRTTLSLKAFHACKDQWFEPLMQNHITMHVLLGNHDIYHKNTLRINSPELLLGEYGKHINIINEPTTIGNFDIIPWICAENEDEVNQFMSRASVARFCMGHFEISGFSMYRGGEPLDHGKPSSIFDNYEMVFSGHYHHKSQKGHILYVGTPYEITWSDYADPKGFHVFDTDSGIIEFIENPFIMFNKVVYDNGWSGDIDSLREKFVKVLVVDKKDLTKFDRFIDSIKLVNPHDLIIVENLDEFKSGEVEETVNLEDSRAIINSYIDGITTTLDKDKIKSYMSSLYNEALTL